MQKLYIIAGCNGAGKTTASYTILPDMLRCNEFVNADEIARGLSPFNPESMAIEAGRLMLRRMNDLLNEGADFAFETTLSTRTYSKFIDRAHAQGYFVSLLYFWLPTPKQAVERVAKRVSEGGHNIPASVVCRRYATSQHNQTSRLQPICAYCVIKDNSTAEGVRKIAYGTRDEIKEIIDTLSYKTILDYE